MTWSHDSIQRRAMSRTGSSLLFDPALAETLIRNTGDRRVVSWNLWSPLVNHLLLAQLLQLLARHSRFAQHFLRMLAQPWRNPPYARGRLAETHARIHGSHLAGLRMLVQVEVLVRDDLGIAEQRLVAMHRARPHVGVLQKL